MLSDHDRIIDDHVIEAATIVLDGRTTAHDLAPADRIEAIDLLEIVIGGLKCAST